MAECIWALRASGNGLDTTGVRTWCMTHKVDADDMVTGNGSRCVVGKAEDAVSEMVAQIKTRIEKLEDSIAGLLDQR